MRFELRLAVIPVCAWIAAAPTHADEPRYGFGHQPSAAEIAAFDIDIRPDGQGLPPGHGSVSDGVAIFAATCAACHGEKGESTKIGTALAGGIGTLASAKPNKTVGSYWPYATTLFDYIRRAMPFNAPQSLSNDEVYAVTAYILALNGIVPQDAVLDAQTLPQIKMPNRDGFTPAHWQDKRSLER
jgi:cytochrome c